jgi:hypothetical protein
MAIDAVDGCPRPNFEGDIELVKKTLTRTDYPILALDEDGNFKKKILGAEVPFDMELEGVRVRGVIDLVFEDDEDTLEICDYKTGRSMSYDKASKDAQVRIYAAVARILYPQYKYIMVTLHYLKTKPVSVPISAEDDKMTFRSLKLRARQISENDNPSQVRPSKWGFPCDWCVGYDNCVEIRDKFKVDGGFRLPILSCGFATESEKCYGNLHPVKDQTVTPDNVREMIYSCRGHEEVHGGGKYIPRSNDSNKTSGPDNNNGIQVQGNEE